MENLDRYDDRLRISTNLIESFDLLMEFVAKHTSDKFFLIDNATSSVRDILAREIISNLLVHRDFSSAFPAKLIIEKDWLRTENWCRPRRHGTITAEEFTPYPKNPLLAAFFVALGRADVLGSGVRNLFKYTPVYAVGGKPELFEADVFRAGIPLTSSAVVKRMEETGLTEREQTIYSMIMDTPKMSIDEIADKLDIPRRTLLRYIQNIKKKRHMVYDKKDSVWKFK